MDRRVKIAKEKAADNRKKVLEFLHAQLPNEVKPQFVVNALKNDMSKPVVYTHLQKLVEINLVIRRQISHKEVYYKAANGSGIELKLMEIVNSINKMFAEPIKSEKQIFNEIDSMLDKKNIISLRSNAMSFVNLTQEQQEKIGKEIILFNRQYKILCNCLRKFYEIYCDILNIDSIKDAKKGKQILFIYPMLNNIKNHYVNAYELL